MLRLHATSVRLTTAALLVCCTLVAHAQPQELLSRARKGDAVAQNELGKIYMRGNGVKASPKTAFSWWMKAAEQGLPNAQTNLAQAYLLGLGTAENHQKAAHWAQKAADQNFSGGYHVLGLLHESSYSLDPATDTARNAFKKAAEMGFAPAQHKYGERVLGGGPKYVGDPIEAEVWLRKSAEQGYGPAQYDLGTLYLDRPEFSSKPMNERCKWFYAAYAQDPDLDEGLRNHVQACNKALSKPEINAIQSTLPKPLIN